MDDPNSTPPTNGEQSNRRLEQASLSQLPFNETSTRTGKQTCNQKLSIPCLEKYHKSSANLWSRKFVQYVKMTKNFDISPLVNSKKILPQYREQMESEIKDIFLWTSGKNALTEMTNTVTEREPSSIPLHKLYTLFRLHYPPERNVQHSRSHFLDLKSENGGSAADVRKIILEVEKNCEFENITAAELVASTFLSLLSPKKIDRRL